MDYAISFYFSAPEVGLSLAGLALLLVAAFVGQHTGRMVTILAVAALTGASLWTANLLLNPAFELGGDAWNGLYRMDAFGSFTKLLIYLATIGCLIVTPKFFDATGEYRPEYPILDGLQRGGHGDDGFGRRSNDAVYRPRADEFVFLCPCQFHEE